MVRLWTLALGPGPERKEFMVNIDEEERNQEWKWGTRIGPRLKNISETCTPMDDNTCVKLNALTTRMDVLRHYVLQLKEKVLSE